MRFRVHRADGDFDVLLLPHKETHKFSFVNLTKGHICPCMFDTVSDAIDDMETRRQQGRLISYTLVE